MKNKILIICPYLSEVSPEHKNRFLFLANLFYSRGHVVDVITSSFCHTTKSQHATEYTPPFNIRYVSAPSYKNLSVKRIFHNLVFSLRLFLLLLNTENKKDYIVITAFPFITSSIALLPFMKSFKKVIIDVQDLWPESFAMFKPKWLHKNIFSIIIYPFYLINKIVFSYFNYFCFVSNTFKRHFVNAYGLKLNETNANVCYIGASGSVYKEKIISYPSDEINLAYVGSLESSYDLYPFIDLVSSYQKKNFKMKLHIFGTGSKFLDYKQYSSSNSNNVIFHGNLSLDLLSIELTKCHIAINPIIQSSKASIINKHADYSLIGLPVINTQSSPEYKELLIHFRAGINVCFDKNEIIEAISDITSSSSIFKSYCDGSKSMSKLFNREISYENYYQFIVKEII